VKTDDLIAALAADTFAEAPLSRTLARDLGLGFVTSLVFFFACVGVRDTFFVSLAEPRFLFKFVFSLSMAASGVLLAWRLARPGADAGFAAQAVLLAPALVVVASLVEMAVTPPHFWAGRMIGHNAVHCLTLIPLMALGPLVGLFAALRHGAPSEGGRAGAAAALAASGLSATLYAMNCPDDSPLFLAVWYMAATGIVVGVGWLAGGRWLRW